MAVISATDRAREAQLQQAWHATTDVNERARLHAEAEALRSKYNYSGGDDGSQYIALNNQSVQRPTLMSGDALAGMYNINTDMDYIRSIFDDTTAAQYNMLRREYDNTANQYYNQMGAAGMTAMDAIRRSNASAVATGASRGLMAAEELSAALGLQQEMNPVATELTQQRNLLNNKEAAAYMQNAQTAYEASSSLQQFLASLANNIYAADVQYGVGQLDAEARINAAAQALFGEQYAADAQRYVADQNLAGTQYAADANTRAAQISAAASAASRAAGSGSNAETQQQQAHQVLATIFQSGSKADFIAAASSILGYSVADAESLYNFYMDQMTAAQEEDSKIPTGNPYLGPNPNERLKGPVSR